MKLILLGAPGAGKGTQAEKISDKFGFPSISTGNIIREAIKNETEAGLKAKSFVESGGLVPDEVVIDMLKERIRQDDCKNGFILDGFPRTVPQAQALSDMGVAIDKVIDIEVPDEAISARMTGRRVCGSCGSSFHVEFNPPKTADVCDRCGEALVIRADDKPETVADRLKVYHDQTEPLKDYYNSVGILYIIDGQEKLEDVTARVFAAIEA